MFCPKSLEAHTILFFCICCYGAYVPDFDILKWRSNNTSEHVGFWRGKSCKGDNQ